MLAITKLIPFHFTSSQDYMIFLLIIPRRWAITTRRWSMVMLGAKYEVEICWIVIRWKIVRQVTTPKTFDGSMCIHSLGFPFIYRIGIGKSQEMR